MTPRMEYYIKVLGQGETVTTGIILFVGGLMLLWVALSLSPWQFTRRLATGPFWTFTLLLFLAVLIGLYFMERMA